MEKGNIQFIDPEKEASIKDIDQAFVAKDFLVDADIDLMATSIAESIKNKLTDKSTEEDIIAIINTLDAEQILNNNDLFTQSGMRLSNTKDLKNITVTWVDANHARKTEIIEAADLEPFLSHIKSMVLDKLASFLPKNINAEIIKSRFGKRVFQLENKKVLKNPIISPSINDSHTENSLLDEYDRSHIEALDFLHSIPENERSPYISFDSEKIDTKNARIIKQNIKLDNLLQIIDSNHKPKLTKMIDYFIDILKGHEFLIAHDLFLTDNALKNLGVNLDTDTGILFDFDGLEKKGVEARYIHHRGCLPPERTGIPLAPITEANIVYELGLSLQGIMPEYLLDDTGLIRPEFTKNEIINFIDNMTDKDPKKRPTIKQIISELEKFKGEIQ